MLLTSLTGVAARGLTFFQPLPPPIQGMDIVTNPPYSLAKEFVEHALDISNDGCKVAMFLKIQFLEGKSRRELFKKYPPKTICQFRAATVRDERRFREIQ